MPNTPPWSCTCARATPTDLCACGHGRDTHPCGKGRCRADDSYDTRCTCDRYEQAWEYDREDHDEALGLADHWACPHGRPTNGRAGHCEQCDDADITETEPE